MGSGFDALGAVATINGVPCAFLPRFSMILRFGEDPLLVPPLIDFPGLDNKGGVKRMELH